MRSKRLDSGEAGASRSFVLVFDTGDEFKRTLTEFARKDGFDAAHFTAIGAFQEATLAYFDWESKEYLPIRIAEQVEVLSLVGDIADKDGQPEVHAHVVVGKRDGTAHGGHVQEAYVRPTLELVLTETPAHLRKRHDQATGLALIDLDEPR